MARIDGIEVGGKEYGTVRLRPLGKTTLEDAQAYEQIGRRFLGDFKQKLQLDGVKVGQRERRLTDGTLIRVITNMIGLVHIDEIHVDKSAGEEIPIQIVDVAIYFKEHRAFYPVESNEHKVTRDLSYFIGEPYNTTGGALNFYVAENGTFPHPINRGFYQYMAQYSNTAKYNGYPSHPDATSTTTGTWEPATRTPEGGGLWKEYVRISQEGYVYNDGVTSDFYEADAPGTAAASPYGMYAASNTCFNSAMPDGFRFKDGYIGKVGFTKRGRASFTSEIPGELSNAVNGTVHNVINILKDEFKVSRTHGFIPGDYIISAMNTRHTGSGFINLGTDPPSIIGFPGSEARIESLHADWGGYTVVFKISNGDTIATTIDVDFSFTGQYALESFIFSDITTTIDPINGIIKTYKLDQKKNPFWKSNDPNTIGTWGIVAQSVPADAKPDKIIDVLARYRQAPYKIIPS